MSVPDYYAVLEVTSSATEVEIRNAYKKAALKWHPDRVPVDSPERPNRTKKFQQINDAYYTLSNKERRAEYDTARMYGTSGSWQEEADEDIPRPPPKTNAGGFPWSAFGFGGGNANAEQQEQKTADAQFSDAFEEMLRENYGEQAKEEAKTGRFWSVAGAVSGGVLGFIVANFIGAATGAGIGGKLGALRDKTGKSAYTVFQELPQQDKMKLLSELAAKVLSSTISA